MVMKRSEILNMLMFSMELHAGNDPAWLDQVPELKAHALDYADKILRDLEAAGMLPPPNSTDVANGRILYCYYNDIENVEDRLVEIDGSYGILDLKKSILWEPE
jgi:hypothetical protein